MPLYEFECQACQKTFEELVRSSVDAEQGVQCPTCGAPDARRVLSATARCGSSEASFGGSSGGGGCVSRGGFS